MNLCIFCRLRVIQLPTPCWQISTLPTTEPVHWHSTTMESMSVTCSMFFVVDKVEFQGEGGGCMVLVIFQKWALPLYRRTPPIVRRANYIQRGIFEQFKEFREAPFGDLIDSMGPFWLF